MAYVNVETLELIEFRAFPATGSWLRPLLTRLLAAYRARQAAKVERILRKGLAATE
jgi:hypothetical protein